MEQKSLSLFLERGVRSLVPGARNMECFVSDVNEQQWWNLLRTLCLVPGQRPGCPSGNEVWSLASGDPKLQQPPGRERAP